MFVTKAYAATSATLIATPLWANVLHMYSEIMQAASVTTGFIVGVLTIIHFYRNRRK